MRTEHFLDDKSRVQLRVARLFEVHEDRSPLRMFRVKDVRHSPQDRGARVGDWLRRHLLTSTRHNAQPGRLWQNSPGHRLRQVQRGRAHGGPVRLGIKSPELNDTSQRQTLGMRRDPQTCGRNPAAS